MKPSTLRRTVTLEGGGQLTLEFNGNLFAMPLRTIKFVFEMSMPLVKYDTPEYDATTPSTDYGRCNVYVPVRKLGEK